LLDLPNIQIQDAFQDAKGHYIVTIISTEKFTHCQKCKERIDKPNGHGEFVTVRHLDILGHPLYLRISLPRFQCDCDGKPTTTQQVSWFKKRSSFTNAFEERLLLSCVNSTFADVAIKEKVSVDCVSGVVDRNIHQSINWKTIKVLGVLGIDEISLKKGHKDFVVIITNRCDDETQILGVLKDRKKQTVKDFFLSIPRRLRRSIRYVCSDMYDGFINAAREVFGKKVRIVADRFHVAKLYREGLDELRKRELRRLKRDMAPAEYKKLKGAMWLLRKNEDEMTEEDQQLLARIFEQSPALKQGYFFRQQLTNIFDQNLTRLQAKRLLNGWAGRVSRSKIRCFDSFIKTLMARKDEISNYFVGRNNSGFVEGLNNKIKVIKRRCYGIVNTESLFRRIYLDLVGYRLYA
jgi:transposase